MTTVLGTTIKGPEAAVYPINNVKWGRVLPEMSKAIHRSSGCCAMYGMTGTEFNSGIAQCGACTVRINGKPARSCLLPIGSTGDRKIITIDKMAQRRSRMRG